MGRLEKSPSDGRETCLLPLEMGWLGDKKPRVGIFSGHEGGTDAVALNCDNMLKAKCVFRVLSLTKV